MNNQSHKADTRAFACRLSIFITQPLEKTRGAFKSRRGWGASLNVRPLRLTDSIQSVRAPPCCILASRSLSPSRTKSTSTVENNTNDVTNEMLSRSSGAQKAICCFLERRYSGSAGRIWLRSMGMVCPSTIVPKIRRHYEECSHQISHRHTNRARATKSADV